MDKKKQSTPEFKAKVVLESNQRDTMMEAGRKKYGVSNSMIHRWRQRISGLDKSSRHANGQCGYTERFVWVFNLVEEQDLLTLPYFTQHLVFRVFRGLDIKKGEGGYVCDQAI